MSDKPDLKVLQFPKPEKPEGAEPEPAETLTVMLKKLIELLAKEGDQVAAMLDKCNQGVLILKGEKGQIISLHMGDPIPAREFVGILSDVSFNTQLARLLQ